MRTPVPPLPRSPTGVVRSLSALLLFALTIPAACRESPDEQPEPGASDAATPSQAPQPPAPLTPDQELAERVRESLLRAPALARENIEIAVVQQQVFLMGEVSAPHLRDEAVAIAGDVEGVRGVQSRISVARR